jgi:transcription elongation factor Elf1
LGVDLSRVNIIKCDKCGKEKPFECENVDRIRSVSITRKVALDLCIVCEDEIKREIDSLVNGWCKV